MLKIKLDEVWDKMNLEEYLSILYRKRFNAS
jgi:hypothetical protein